MALQVAGLCCSAKNLTDGRLPARVAGALAGQVAQGVAVYDDAGTLLDMTASLLTEAMVSAGLWERAGGAYVVPTTSISTSRARAAVEAHRQRAKQRMRRPRGNDAGYDVTQVKRTEQVPGTGTGSSTLRVVQDADWLPTEQAHDPFVAAHRLTGRVPTGRLADWSQ